MAYMYQEEAEGGQGAELAKQKLYRPRDMVQG
ncbi:hypothetical protein A2U01_0098519, partial [Trifolium medium]|nr:hypothetical protein [Trifolium medium]